MEGLVPWQLLWHPCIESSDHNADCSRAEQAMLDAGADLRGKTHMDEVIM